MEFLSNLSDNQLALLGCVAALAASGTLMAVSYYAGRFSFRQAGKSEPNPIEIAGSTSAEVRTGRSDEVPVPPGAETKPTRRAA